jgi:hypothetical protein
LNLLTKIVKETLEKVKKPGEYFNLNDEETWCMISCKKYSKKGDDIPNQVMATIELHDGVLSTPVGWDYRLFEEFQLADPDCLMKFEKHLKRLIHGYTPGAKPKRGMKYVQIPVNIKGQFLIWIWTQ